MTIAHESPDTVALRDRFTGCLLGLACGDAVGTTLEFMAPGTFRPISDMVGGGPFRLAPGQWTDDTSMALCLATSLLERGGFDAADQMERYWRWYAEGYLSSTGRCFDIGNATLQALRRFHSTGEPFAGSTDPNSAGNGSIMRLAPVPMYFYGNGQLALEIAALSSKTTHGAPECVDACRLFGAVLLGALKGRSKEEILLNHGIRDLCSPGLQGIALGDYLTKPASEILGSGYVVKSLEASLWCFANSNNFESAILTAANLGNDADTTAAITGQVAGAFYGASGIPEGWLERLCMVKEIEGLAEGLLRGASA